MTLWIHNPSSTGALQKYLQAEELGQECSFSTNVDKLMSFYKNLLVGDWPILCGRKQAIQGPPRTSQHIAAHQSSTSKIFFSRTPKSYLQRSWVHNPEDSKNNPLVRACKCRANREPSLIAGVGHISWLMMSLLALTRQKQLAKSRQAVSKPVSQC